MPDRSFVRGELLLLLNLCGFSHVVRVDLLATFPLPHLDFDAPASLSSFLPYPSPHPLLPLPRNDSALFADSPRAPHLPLCVLVTVLDPPLHLLSPLLLLFFS
jgi:hypothetical protein